VSLTTHQVLLFHRDFGGLTGGHLKVWHYFGHACHSRRFRPRIYFTPRSLHGPGNPWHGVQPPPLAAWRPTEAAVLFVAGLDWDAVPDPAPAPIINLIQGVQHSAQGNRRRAFLTRPAIRICVSGEVAAAITSTGMVNGPVHVIPNGIDFDALPLSASPRDLGVLIAGRKNPPFARALHQELRRAGIVAECLVDPLPRDEFLGCLARSAVAVTLPKSDEGFFLPALEAMAIGAVVVCPDCVGNRSFCRDRETAFRPPYAFADVLAATLAAVRQEPQASQAMRDAATREARRHSLEAERSAFLRILDAVQVLA
jgi:glycosyltransferase involved in cell wall biosynthesis